MNLIVRPMRIYQGATDVSHPLGSYSQSPVIASAICSRSGCVTLSDRMPLDLFWVVISLAFKTRLVQLSGTNGGALSRVLCWATKCGSASSQPRDVQWASARPFNPSSTGTGQRRWSLETRGRCSESSSVVGTGEASAQSCRWWALAVEGDVRT